MKIANLGGIIPGAYRGVSYEAKAAVSAVGGFKAGFRFSIKDDWTWGDGKFESVNAALDAGAALAREAISFGRHESQESAS